MDKLASRLKALRKEKGLTQEDLARLVGGVTRQAVANWEAGHREPDHATLTTLANIFGVTTDYLLGRTDDPHSSANSSSLTYPDDDELYVVFRGKRQELSPEYKRLLILMMEDANRKLREEQEKKK